ncbi:MULTISPECIES: aldehyde dehydrogenase family protein [Lelliottia]|uniref:aldehyde dehydrogenase (NAD(+)) n=1 Tax=Lelliottia aquatilis TaxID=2080838 RepID=A0ABX5A091_9ENTR|nr:MULTISPECIES: aldehyde dehydrogenase family protein [Lelliottia]NTZ47329.1 aldehyde dehydrogenase family protein [Lelliottia aquatilis]POZ17792.1 aldehyde dehydrogenase family protein [Lelliottia sp. 7254-16]POZ21286.1 aldehyde dehydrogenase family protein [Lelliottia aquatilis]POZ23211.1 aldehyde dehydrogenase family protein [Lelliottia aquatilis]POZ31509.1 aldehyde dehydrogenase family protein [Lelliottia aquatilis]
MRHIEQIFINGEFVTPHGTERFDLYNPATAQVFGQVRLADEHDAERAIAAAKAAFPGWAKTTREERIAALKRMHAAVTARHDELLEAIIEEYGAPASRSAWMASYPADVIAQAIDALESFEFTTQTGAATVQMTPLGVAGLITPWNSDAGFICGKLAAALAAGCTAVIKPSEMSAWQTQIITEALNEAGLPAGVFNIVTGRGETVGETISRHPDVAKISFTGSTNTGKAILRNAAESFKRVTLELGGKSPTIVLEDADLAEAVPLAIQAGLMNSGQACVAGTRILVPQSRKAECETALAEAMAAVKSGDPRDPATEVGPMVSEKQWLRVQGYIRKGTQEGARLLAGGEGRPDGTQAGWFVRPTLFTDVDNQMTIARDEIFGPVLSIITYRDEDEAIAIANDTDYGLSALVLGGERASVVAQQIESGRVLVNTLAHEPKAPFGGFKHSGVGREMGAWGISAFMEPRTIIG